MQSTITGHSKSAFAYLDPPYYLNGNRLYSTFYNDRNHAELAHYIQRQRNLNWVMSYDDTKFIRDRYADSEIVVLPLEYSLQGRREENELLISPSHVILAHPFVPSNARERESLGALARNRQ